MRATTGRRRRRLLHVGAGMTEFALVAPLLFLLSIGIVDVARVALVNSTVAEAARQGARQAAANDQETSPFGAYSAPCSGTVLTTNVSGTGCLSDAAILATVQAVLKDDVPTSMVTLYTGYSPDKCGTTNAPGNVVAPAAGSAIVCIAQLQTQVAGGGAPADCGGVWALSTYPASIGGRSNEFTSHTYKGCYLIQVTVVVTYQALTPAVSRFFPAGGVVVRSTTGTIAEY